MLKRRRWVGGVVLLGLGLAAIGSLGFGSGAVPLGHVVEALRSGIVDSPESAIVWHQRVPRAVIALLAGAALGLAGALTQALTRNPLAEPGTLGISSGASLFVAIGIFAHPGLSISLQLALAMAGAAISGVLVLAAGGVLSGRQNTVRLVLAGAAWSAVTSAATSSLILGNAAAFEEFRSWHAGAVTARPWPLIIACAGLFLVVALSLVPLCPAIDALGLGEDLGRALGASPARVWALTGIITLVAASAATALVGPIAFLGLAAPLAVRRFVGPGIRTLVTWSAVLGAGMLLLADVVGRVLLPPQEVTAGVMCGLLGAPVFVAVARRTKVVSL